jgi:glycosyltransferase involved in cell wall biosynthesis
MSVATAEREPRVLMLVDSLRIGGVGRVTVSLVDGLRVRGMDARVAHLGIGDSHPLAPLLQANGVPVIDLRLGSLLDPRPELWLAGYLRREQIDLVHTHTRYTNLVGRAAAMLARRPVITTIHDIVETGTGWRDAVRRQLDHWSARTLCAAIVTVSEAQRRVYLRATGVAPTLVETHLNGIDTDWFRPDPPERVTRRAELGLSADTPLFVTVAALRAGKGLNFLLEAAALVREREPVARFAIVGDGVERTKLEVLAQARGLGGTVSFLGERSDVRTVLAAADVYVHPSLFEALPTSVLEAMAVGLPVVATAVGGVPEIVAHEQTGLLVPPARADDLAAAMLRLLDPVPRIAMGSAGRAWVEVHTSRNAWLDDLQRVYRRVVRRQVAADPDP